MWSDNETAVDLLGYKHLVASVTAIVQDDSLSPATVGVFGDWGGGKSSLLKMVEEQLRSDSDTLVLSFNGWLFEGYEDAKSALMGVILDEIKDKRTLTTKGEDLLKKLLRRVNWFRVAGAAAKHGTAFALLGPAGLGLTAAADLAGYTQQISEKLGSTVKDISSEDIGSFLAEEAGQEARKAVREFRTDFAELLADSKINKLVVLIDDLDRCLPPVVIEILEAIKLFLFVDHTAFVIGADERLVKYAVRRRFPEIPGEVAQVADEYLEKLIQYPVRIPALDSAEMETYINLLFAAKADLKQGQFEKIREQVIDGPPESLLSVRFNSGIAQELLGEIPSVLKSQLAMAQRIAPVLSTGLKGNPRQCKRFLNTLVMREQMARSRKLDLKQRILAKLMLLEYLHSEWFRRLADLQAASNGLPPELQQLEQLASGGAQAPAKEEKPKKGKKVTKENGEDNTERPATPLPEELKAWLADDWMKDWLTSSPSLQDVDLRPYFYFSRDRLGAMASAASRMTPTAQKVLQQLLHESEAQQLVALREAERLSPADASAIYDALTERVEQEDDLRSEKSALPRMVNFCEKRSELLSQLLSLFGRLPIEQIPLSMPVKIAAIIKGQPVSQQGRQLLVQWTQQTTVSGLAQAAKNALERT